VDYKWLVNMSREQNHFRGESFGAEGVVDRGEEEEEVYLQTLVEHYKNCLLLERTGKNPNELIIAVRSVEREIELMDSWNQKMEDMMEIKELEVERLKEDIQNADEELTEVDRVRRELELRIEKLYNEKSVKDAIIERQDFLICALTGRTERLSTPKKVSVSKSSRTRHESPTLV